MTDTPSVFLLGFPLDRRSYQGLMQGEFVGLEGVGTGHSIVENFFWHLDSKVMCLLVMDAERTLQLNPNMEPIDYSLYSLMMNPKELIRLVGPIGENDISNITPEKMVPTLANEVFDQELDGLVMDIEPFIDEEWEFLEDSWHRALYAGYDRAMYSIARYMILNNGISRSKMISIMDDALYQHLEEYVHAWPPEATQAVEHWFDYNDDSTEHEGNMIGVWKNQEAEWMIHAEKFNIPPQSKLVFRARDSKELEKLKKWLSTQRIDNRYEVIVATSEDEAEELAYPEGKPDSAW